MWKTKEGSTQNLLQLCLIYFFSYIVTGVAVKYFLGKPELGFPGMKDMEFLVYNTSTSVGLVSFIAVALGWAKMQSNRLVKVGPFSLPSELLYIIPSGICTAVVIPATTLMYTLPISVMVAMVIMRGAVIVVSRLVDAIQISQGILTKKVYWEENVAVLFAILAVCINIFMKPAAGAFDFVKSPAAMTILTSYVISYALRIYIMNYYKNTRGRGIKQDNKGFFTWEQLSAAVTIIIVAIIIFFAPDWFGYNPPQIEVFRDAIINPKPMWGWAMFSGLAYATVAFVSVFIFLFKGRTATFAGLVNRLTSLTGGTVATLVFYLMFGGKFPSLEDWVSLGVILVAVTFLSKAEKKRVKELAL